MYFQYKNIYIPVQKYLFQYKKIFPVQKDISSTKIFIPVQKYISSTKINFQYKSIFPVQKYISSTKINFHYKNIFPVQKYISSTKIFPVQKLILETGPRTQALCATIPANSKTSWPLQALGFPFVPPVGLA